ncbi:MAG: MarC family protein [bacterium]
MNILNDITAHTLAVFMGFSAIMNPIANVPIFLSLTAEIDQAAITRIALRSCGLAFLIVTLFCLASVVIFSVFGITLPAFQTTGGILVFLIGFHMLQGNQSPVHHLDKDECDVIQKAGRNKGCL